MSEDLNHKFKNYLFVKDNFFTNPTLVYELSLRQQYFKSDIYPGCRTENLFDSADQLTKNFAQFCAHRIKYDVFPGLTTFMLDIRFHINEKFDLDVVNSGWIHSDPADLAGLVYLTPTEENFYTGTSIFVKNTKDEFDNTDVKSRLNFNSQNSITESYIEELDINQNSFEETIRVGNKYNRAVAYDAHAYHRPNRYDTHCGELRRTLLFFIKGFSYTEMFNPNLLQWKDQ